jgi:3D (Asp-Asp-Asp) domain-containing protein
VAYRFLVLCALINMACSQNLAADNTPIETQPTPVEDSTKNPEPKPTLPSDFSPMGDIQSTVYYKPIIKFEDFKCETKDLKPLINTKGEIMLVVCDAIYKKCLMQGSCVLEIEGKLVSYNYYGEIEGSRRFSLVTQSRCQFGLGTKDICLDPFYTVAADPSFHDEGDVIFIPSVLGTILPNGEMHSGFFVVRDRGEAIIGANRFDFFTGFIRFGTTKNPFSILGLDAGKKNIAYYKVTGQTAKNVKKARNYPNYPKTNAKVMSLDLMSETLTELQWHSPAMDYKEDL